MSTSASDSADDVRPLRLQRFHLDQQKLADGSKALVSLDTEIAAAARQVESLSIKLRDLESYRAKLAQQNDDVRRRVETQQRALFPFQNLPEDVLGVIFSWLAAEPDLDWTQLGQGYFNKARAQSPFTVAAVCPLWRSAAINTPQIWNYAGIPDLEENQILAERTLARIRVIVSRSGATPLDVLFEKISNPDQSYFALLGILYPEMYRWRWCEIFASCYIRGLLDYLRGPAPRLKRLFIVQGDPDEVLSWPEDNECYFSHNPPLRRLIIKNTAIMPGRCPTLQHLELTALADTPSDIFWSIFRNFSNLIRLDLTVYDADAFNSPQTAEMSVLQVLSLREDAPRIPIRYPQFLRVPSLSTITIDKTWPGIPGHNLNDLRNFMGRLASEAKVTWLCITSATLNRLDGDFIASQNFFRGIVSLTLKRCTIHGAFWNTLCATEVLPNLRSLDLLSVAFEEGSFRKFVQFLRWRKTNNCRLATSVVNSGLSNRDEVELKYISEW